MQQDRELRGRLSVVFYPGVGVGFLVFFSTSHACFLFFAYGSSMIVIFLFFWHVGWRAA